MDAPLRISAAHASDEALLARVAEKDREAFEVLYERHSARVLGLLLRIVNRRSEAEDLLQDTFWQAWRRADAFDPARGRAAVWLAMIARSRALDALRRRSLVSGGAEIPDVVLDDTTALVGQQESCQLARRALAQLPVEQRGAIQLAFFGGLTHEQIAERESIPLGTVKTRIRLGMRRIRALLEPHATGLAS